MGLRDWWERLKKRGGAVLLSRVSCDDTGVSCQHPDGAVQRVGWDELTEVVIVTTDQGPFQDDVYWILHSPAGDCVVPSEAEGADELVGRLQKLSGFDHLNMIAAMSSTTNQRFVCWQRQT